MNHTDGTLRVKITSVSPLVGNTIPWPDYQTPGSAGVDLAACIDEPITMAPGCRQLIPTGIAIQLPGPHVGAFVFARSGLATNAGIHLANGVGVIDSDYIGEVKVPLVNGADTPFLVNPGDRIAQMVFMPVWTADFVRVDRLDSTERGTGGFGHTGV